MITHLDHVTIVAGSLETAEAFFRLLVYFYGPDTIVRELAEYPVL